MECALTVINQGGRRLGLPEATVIFNLATDIKVIKPASLDDPYMDFLSFLEIARIYYFFSNFDIPFSDGQLTKKDLLRAVTD